MLNNNFESFIELDDGFYGPGKKPMFFKNEGLFDDPTLASLGTSKNPHIRNLWDTEDLANFAHTYEWMMDKWSSYKEILPNLDEAQLEEQWIKPILKKLGWEYEVQDRFKHMTKQEIPDYSLFENEAQYITAKGSTTNDGYFSHVLAVADAKKMGTPLDGGKLNKTNPSYQIWWYLTITGKDWGILTDGLKWRIYSPKPRTGHYCYFEVKIDRMLVEKDDKAFKYFYNIFRKEAVQKKAGEPCFLDMLYAKAEGYSQEVEQELQLRAFHLVEGLAKGFATNYSNTELADPNIRSKIYSHSLYYLFRLMFVLNSEARGLLAIGKQETYYKYSLRSLSLNILEDFKSNSTWSSTVSRSYNYLQSLFKLLENGDDSIGIHGFGKEIFENGDKTFFLKNAIADKTLNRILLDLSFSKKDDLISLIDFKCLSVDHIGSIFEGLLEFKFEIAEKNTVIKNDFLAISNKSESSIERTVPKGELYLSTNGKTRKELGAFYTKDYIVNYIVENSLAKAVQNMDVEQILKLKITDPAMGSGHFLIGVVSYLDRVVQQKLLTENKGDIDPSEVKWVVLKNCVYGVDKNPLACELAKFSLWIFSARIGYQLESLENKFQNGNSLIDTDHAEVVGEPCPPSIKAFNWNERFPDVFCNGGFDAVLGNPPFIETKLIAQEERPYLYAKYESMFEKSNYYVCFYELSEKILKKEPHARLSFVTPPDWLDAQKSYRPFKNFLVENFKIKEICKLDKNAFPVATNIYFFHRPSAGKINLIASELFPTKVFGKWEATHTKDSRTTEEVYSLGTSVTGALPSILKNAKPIVLGTEFRIELGISFSDTKFEKCLNGSERFLNDGVSNQIFLNAEDTISNFNYSKAEGLKGTADRLRTAELFLGEKIILKRRPFTVVLESRAVFCKSNCMVIKNNGKNKLDLKSLAIIMNSTWFKGVIHEKSKFAQLGKTLFDELQIPYIQIANSDLIVKELKKHSYAKQVELIDQLLNGIDVISRKAA